MKVALYARVSTKDKSQEVENQLVQLRDYCAKNGYEVYKEYIDRKSGTKADREQFQALFKDAHQRRFDLVFFWALDRFSREGARETINYLARLEDAGIKFTSFTEPYLSNLGIFKEAIISLLATLAKQESVRRSERVLAGLAIARSRGAKFGRPSIKELNREEILELRNSGLSYGEISKRLKIPKATVYRVVSKTSKKQDSEIPINSAFL